jgi:hypothetical protein
MYRLLVVAGMLAILAAPAAAAQDTHRVSKTEVTFTTPVVVGTTTLAPGRYRFECRMIDGQHVMVVTQKGKEMARVPCTPTALDSEVTETGYRTVKRGEERVLTEIRIHGESIAHRLVPTP